MTEGGAYLGEIRDKLAQLVKPGVTPLEIEQQAEKLIKKTGGQPSFKMVKGYYYCTCINVNDGIVHGIPTKTPFKDTDLVSIDLGLYFKGYHTDTSTSVVAGNDQAKQRLIDIDRQALNAGIKNALPGNDIKDISKAMEVVIKSNRYQPIKDLTGHGIGRNLHEEPYVLNYFDPNSKPFTLKPGQALAIEPMFSVGSPKIKLLEDDWTIATEDGSLSVLVEDTIIITDTKPLVVTNPHLKL